MEENTKKSENTKKLLLLIAVIALTTVVTWAGPALILPLPTPSLRRVGNCLLYVVLALPSLAAMKLTGMRFRDVFPPVDAVQVLTGVSLALGLSLCIAVIPAMLGVSLVGEALDLDWGVLLWNLFFFLLFVGPVEELVFRVYVQETIAALLGRRWAGAILASALFGLWHLINGSLVQALFTCGIGCVFGFARLLIRRCTYFSVALGHGLYDFLNVVVRMFLV